MPDHEHQRSLPQLLRCIRLGDPLPTPGPDEPSDDELIRLIDGSLSDGQRRSLEARLSSCPYSADRVAIVRDALQEAGVVLPRVWCLSDD